MRSSPPPQKLKGRRFRNVMVVLLMLAAGIFLSVYKSGMLHSSALDEASRNTPSRRPTNPVTASPAAPGFVASRGLRNPQLNEAPANDKDGGQLALSIREKEGAIVDGGSGTGAVAGRGLTCPPYDAALLDALQIPLKHLPRKKKTSVREKYDRRAHNCASNGIWNRVTIDDHHKILHGIARLGRIQRNSFVLDWGSGCGHSIQFLFDEMNVTGVGIDVSILTIAYAKENTTKANMHCVADGTKLQWIPDNFFDHSYSFGSIYHVYNRTMFCHVLRQLVRVVKVGGTIYNGWTENAEFKRVHLPLCLSDLPVDVEVFEELKEFANVPIFPLKAEQDKPNTYSLVITKKGNADGSKYLWENRPMDCGVHVCELRAASHKAAALAVEVKNQLPAQPTAAQANAVLQQLLSDVGATPTAAAAVVAVDEASDVADHEGWPACPPYDHAIDALQIPLEHLPRKKKTSVAQKYDRRAAQCATNGVWHRVTIQDHESIIVTVGQLLKLKRDDVVFDWGSGCGHQLEFLTNHYRTRGIGVDVSNLTIAYAAANTTKVNRHCVGDGTKLQWIPDNFFDHSYSFGSIYHVYNTTLFCSVLRQMVRITKPGGRIYNGWTENKEFPRADVYKCINAKETDGHNVLVLEEKDTFRHVQTFPLKKDRRTPNTYSLLIQKQLR